MLKLPTSEELIHLACHHEEAYLELVRKDSEKIPLSVKMFLGDKVRNTLMGMRDQERANRITAALSEVGI